MAHTCPLQPVTLLWASEHTTVIITQLEAGGGGERELKKQQNKKRNIRLVECLRFED